MIRHIELRLLLPEKESFRTDMAYALYGALCHCMTPVLADTLHAQKITPIRQHLRSGPEPGQCTWVLDLFDAAAELENTIRSWKTIDLQCCSAPLQVMQYTAFAPISVAALLEKGQTWPPASTAAEFLFETPCTFKVAGSYALFPSVELIVQSLWMRWNALMPDCTLEDADAQHLLLSGLRICRYRLSSRDYKLKGQRIPGFVGSVQISARLPAPMMELWHLLLAFAPYSGIGIKTALGMGAVRITPVIRKSNVSWQQK